jgi:hypothetical protein
MGKRFSSTGLSRFVLAREPDDLMEDVGSDVDVRREVGISIVCCGAT